MRTRAALAALALSALVIQACSPPAEEPIPAGAPQVLCQGVPQPACRQAFDGAGVTPGSFLRAVVRCTLPVCTDATGEAEVTVFLLDGRQVSSGYGWASAPAVPVAPPVPDST